MTEYILALKAKVDCVRCGGKDKQVVYINDISDHEMCLVCAKKNGLKKLGGMDLEILTVVKAKVWGSFIRRLLDVYYKAAHLDFMKGGRLTPKQFVPRTANDLIVGGTDTSKDMKLVSYGAERIEVHYRTQTGSSFVFLVEGVKEVDTFMNFVQQYLNCGHKNDTFEFDKIWW